MSISNKSSLYLQPQSWLKKTGFSLIEIILTLVIVGIIAGLVGPFLGQVLGNFVDARQLSDRERQATLALERFVRDVRKEGNVYNINNGGNTLSLNNNNIVYRLQASGVLTRNGEILARYIDNGRSSFDSQPINSAFDLIILNLSVRVNSQDSLEYSTAAVQREG